MKKFSFIVIGVIILTIIFGLLGLQLIALIDFDPFSKNSFAELMEFKPIFDYRIYFESERNRNVFTLFLMFWGLAMFVLFTNAFSKSKYGKKGKKYKPDTAHQYTHLASTFETKRGLLRIEYTRDGEIKDWSIRNFADQKFNGIKKFHNALNDRFKKPRIKNWNTIKTFERPEGVIKHSGGVPIRAERYFLNLIGHYSKFYYLVGQDHNLFVGSTGRGKSMTFVILMLISFIMAKESFVAHDPKAELVTYTEDILKKNGYQIIRLDWTDPTRSQGWNPLWLAWMKYKEAFSTEWHHQYELLKNSKHYLVEVIKKSEQTIEVLEKELEGLKLVHRSKRRFDLIQETEIKLERELVNLKDLKDRYTEKQHPEDIEIDPSEAIELVLDVSLALTYQKNIKDPYWTDGASGMITGAALYFMEKAIEKYEVIENEKGELELSFPYEKYINFRSILYLYDNLMNAKTFEEVAYILQTKKDADSVINMSTFINADGPTRPGLRSTFSKSIQLVTSTNQVSEMTSDQTFDFNSIFTQKTAVFLLTHDEKATYYPLVTLFFRQLYEAGIKVTRQNPKGQKLDIPMNFVIEEMGVLPPIKDIQGFYAAARSREIRIHAFIQSFFQLKEAYGDKVAAIIEDNSNNQIYLGSSTLETRERFSDKAGKRLVWSKSKEEWATHEVITSEELNNLKPGKFLVTSIEKPPIISDLPMITKTPLGKNIVPKDHRTLIEKKPVSTFFLNDHVVRKSITNNESKAAPENNEPKSDVAWKSSDSNK